MAPTGIPTFQPSDGEKQGRAERDRVKDREARDRAEWDRATRNRKEWDRAKRNRATRDRAKRDREERDRAVRDRAKRDRAMRDREEWDRKYKIIGDQFVKLGASLSVSFCMAQRRNTVFKRILFP